MKILFIDQNYHYIGGTEQYYLEVAKELEKLGHKVIIIYGNKNEETVHVENRKEYHVPNIEDMPILPDNTPTLKVSEIIKHENPDLIYIHNIRNWHVVRACCNLKPTIRFIHDPTICCLRDWKIFRDQKLCTKKLGINCILYGCINISSLHYFRRLINKSKEIKIHNSFLQYFIVASNYMKEILIQNGINKEKIVIIPYFTRIPKVEVEYPKKENIILYVGTMHTIKGVEYLIKALSKVKINYRAIFIGTGEYLEKYKEMTKIVGISDKVEFLGFLPNQKLTKYYETCSVVVIPSIWPEPFGIVGIEAMAHGKPVIASRVGGITDWLSDKQTGFFAERTDSDDIADKISFILQNKDLAKKIGNNSRERVKNLFSKENHINSLFDVFKKCIS